MKLWEVIKELTEDPTKKFERKDRYKHWVIGTDVVGGAISGRTYYFMLDCDGEDSYGDAGKFNGNLANNEDDWQLVHQPVTWQGAIQAWADGKTIKTESSDGIRTYKRTTSSLQSVLGGVTKDEILNGKWYVEENV